MNNLTVLILAAGYGRRMGQFSRMINKSLVPYNNKPLISHIFDKFDPDTKFVIACGHMGEQVKNYLTAVHSEKNLTFVDINEYSEGNTGPATTIKICADHISGPFIWLSCDTLFDFDYRSKMDHNWIAVHPVDSTISRDYCWVRRNGDRITEIVNKKSCKTAVDAFIGLMFCKDSTFVENLKLMSAKEVHEGLLENLELHAHTVNDWYDFGTYEKWSELNSNLPEVSFPKPNELFYNDNGKIIKFTVNEKLAERKYQRAILNPLCMPDNIKQSGQFLVYDYADGDIVYDILTTSLFDDLLTWSQNNLWKPKWFPDITEINFKFYQEKTLSRLKDFRIKHSEWSEPCVINGENVLRVEQYINMIDWDWLCSENDWRFIHGDFQFENIIYNKTTKKFTCIDWRTDFGGDDYGDLYYDLAKIAGGIILNYQAVKDNKLEYYENDESVVLNNCSIENSDLYLKLLEEWCNSNNLTWKKVKILIPIIYLNMSPLHTTPFDKYLFSLAQVYFAKFFNEYPKSNNPTN